jgi:hypothetical protein
MTPPEAHQRLCLRGTRLGLVRRDEVRLGDVDRKARFGERVERDRVVVNPRSLREVGGPAGVDDARDEVRLLADRIDGHARGAELDDPVAHVGSARARSSP